MILVRLFKQGQNFGFFVDVSVIGDLPFSISAGRRKCKNKEDCRDRRFQMSASSYSKAMTSVTLS